MGTDTVYNPDSLTTPAVIANPYPAYEQLRSQSPLQYPFLPAGAVPSVEGPFLSWGLLRYADVYYALRNHDVFSSVSQTLADADIYPRLALITDDPPRHSRLRRLVNQTFTTRRIEALVPWIVQIANNLLDAVGTEETDMMESFAIPLPVAVIARLMGIPQSEYLTFRRWSEAVLAIVGMPSEERQRNAQEMMAFFGKMAAERRAQGAEDLITALVEAEVDGEALEEWEILGFCIVLLVAGNNTTVNLLGNIMNLLADRPDLLHTLREDRSLVEPFIEETLRYESPVQRLFRTTTCDIELSGVRIPQGEVVTLFYGAANRDSDAFAAPNEFRLDRDLRNHVAFGAGIHYCLGAPLARTEARIALNILLDRYGSLRHGLKPAIRQSASATSFGFQQLPLLLSRS